MIVDPETEEAEYRHEAVLKYSLRVLEACERFPWLNLDRRNLFLSRDSGHPYSSALVFTSRCTLPYDSPMRITLTNHSMWTYGKKQWRWERHTHHTVLPLCYHRPIYHTGLSVGYTGRLIGSDADRVIAITDCRLDPILFEINLPAFAIAIDEINATEYKNA